MISVASLRIVVRPLAAMGLLVSAAAVHAERQLPDLIPWADQTKCYMYCGSIQNSVVPGKTMYRFDLPIPNMGDGRLELREVTSGTEQDIYQRFYDEAGDLIEGDEHHVGHFTDVYPPYGHMYLQGIAHYRIREVLPGDGVGDVLTTHEKISYALTDGVEYDLSLSGAPLMRQYIGSNSPLLGISVGWADIYTDSLPMQWADLTGLADGDYWLEVEIDPFDLILETNETNNVTRIKLENLVIPEPTVLAGDYNGDDLVDARDYVLWRNSLGDKVQQGTLADGDASGRIGPPDYAVWKAHYGASEPSPGGLATPAPEPTGAALALIAFAACVFTSRSRRE